MGVFADWQPHYATHNIPTFPVQIGDDRKKPATVGYSRVGIQGSEQLALKFPEIDAFAFMAGKRTRLTVVDIDNPDDALLRDTLKRHGQTPIMVRSSSGGFHLWYRFNSEGRKIRPDAQVPVDVLGGGVVVAPPSMGAKGPYEFIRGSLDDLHKLRPANNVIAFPGVTETPRPALVGLITEGRNNALFNHLMRDARHCVDLANVEELAFDFANNLTDRTTRHVFSDAEIRATALSVWRITERGDNRFGGEPHGITPKRLYALGADACFLRLILKDWSGDKKTFPCANGMIEHMPGGKWSLERLRTARQALIDAGVIIEVRRASSVHGPVLYEWG